jgi:hypothetical protein
MYICVLILGVEKKSRGVGSLFLCNIIAFYDQIFEGPPSSPVCIDRCLDYVQQCENRSRLIIRT